MTPEQMTAFLKRLRVGTFEEADCQALESTAAREVVALLRPAYRVEFQNHETSRKWEVALARSVRADADLVEGEEDAPYHFVPEYVGCVMLNVENGRVTGVTALARLSLRQADGPASEVLLTSGKGYKLDRTPDGWEIKVMRKRTVTLPLSMLRERGWRLSRLRELLPTA